MAGPQLCLTQRHHLLLLALSPLQPSLSADFYGEHYGIGGMQDSALRILDVALGAAEADCKARSPCVCCA